MLKVFQVFKCERLRVEPFGPLLGTWGNIVQQESCTSCVLITAIQHRKP